MNTTAAPPIRQSPRSIADRLNEGCFCITLDQDALYQALETEAGDPAFCHAFIRTRPHLFSNVRFSCRPRRLRK